MSHRPPASQQSLAVQDVEAVIARRLAEISPCEQNVPNLLPSKSPFTEAIQAEVLPVGTNLLKFESYDGSTDPVDNFVQFENIMLLHNFTNAMYCKAFAKILKFTAQPCFH